MKHIKIVGALVCAICSLSFGNRVGMADEGKSTFSQATGKKLLEFTWGPPCPEYMMEHPEALDKWPFDGTIMRPFFGSGQVFNIKVFRDHRELISQQFDKYAPINPDKLTDNFLAMYSQSSMDWFSDEDWKDIQEYVTLLSKGAKTLGCKGVMFDAEPYGANPWNYERQEHSKTKTYDEYAAKARQRGREFMEAINKGFPNAKVLFLGVPYASFYKITHSSDPNVRKDILLNTKGYTTNTYLLYLSFYTGMLEAATKGNHFTNATQGAYGNSSAEEFYEQYWIGDQGAKVLAPPELREKYSRIGRVGTAVYVDGVMGAGNFHVAATARELSEQERLKWLEYNVYQSLKTSDEYILLYGEQVTWWREKDSSQLNSIRPQMVQAIHSAQDKVMKGEDVGYEMKPAVDAAKQKAEERKNSLAAKIKPKSATIQKVQKVPVLDGKLDDAVYEEISWLDPFVTFAKMGGKPTASTQIWAAYDEQNLYVAFRNAENNMSKQKVLDADIWMGETNEIFLLASGELPRSPHSTYYHLMLNPRNVKFNAIEKEASGTKEPFTAAWKSAISSDDKGWYAEIALPWKGLGFSSISKGMSIHINFARHRAATQNEYTSWSQYLERFQEPENFGRFVLE